MNKFLMIIVLSVACVTEITVAGEYSMHKNEDSEITKSTDIKMLAEKWGITEPEYTRYLEIMKGPLGRWNENLDPVFALGIYSETEAQQKKYAELLARQEYALASRTIEFERVYRAVFKRLFPDVSMIDPELLQPYYANRYRRQPVPDAEPVFNKRFQPGDRIVYFAHGGRCAGCLKDISALMRVLGNETGVVIDVYVIDTTGNDEVNRWANINKLDVKWVDNRLTLNPDAGLYQRVTANSADKTGHVYLSRGGQLYKVDKKQLGL